MGQTDCVGSSDSVKVATVAAVRLFAETEQVAPLFVNETRDARSAVTRMCRDDCNECELKELRVTKREKAYLWGLESLSPTLQQLG